MPDLINLQICLIWNRLYYFPQTFTRAAHRCVFSFFYRDLGINEISDVYLSLRLFIDWYIHCLLLFWFCVCMCVHMYVCASACMYACKSVLVYACVWTLACVCMCERETERQRTAIFYQISILSFEMQDVLYFLICDFFSYYEVCPRIFPPSIFPSLNQLQPTQRG